MTVSLAKYKSLSDTKALIREARKCIPLCKLCHYELHGNIYSLYPKNPLDKHHNR